MENLYPVNILLIEDNHGDTLLTSEILKESKVFNNLHVVYDGKSALEFLDQKGEYKNAPVPNLILLDLILPDIDGTDILKKIKTDDKLKKIPVVVLTSQKDENELAKTYSLHANCIVAKPLNSDKLLKVLNSIESFWLSIVSLPGRKKY